MQRLTCRLLAATLFFASLPAELFAFTLPQPAVPFRLPGASEITVPAQMGSVVERWQPADVPAAGLVFIFQDVHTHMEAQVRLSQLLAYLQAKFSLEQVLLEGATGRCDIAAFTSFPDAALNEQAALWLMEQGIFTGAEYYGVAHPGRIALSGVEDPGLYSRQLAFYRSSAQQRVAALRFLQELRIALAKQEKNLPRGVRRLLSAQISMEEDRGGNHAAAFMEELESALRQEHFDLEPYPHLVQCFRDRSGIGTLDYRSVQEELRSLLTLLWRRLDIQDRDELRALARAIQFGENSSWEYYAKVRRLACEKGGFCGESLPYPTLREYFRRADMFQETQTREVWAEAMLAARDLEERLVQTPAQRALLHGISLTRILDRLLRIQLTPAQWIECQQAFSAGIRLVISDAFEQWDIPIPIREEELQSLIETARQQLEFYHLAEERNDALAGGTIAKLAQSDKKLGFLSVGGFHTLAILQRFKEEQIAYVVLSPAVSEPLNQDRYLARLQGPTVFAKLHKRAANQAMQVPIASDATHLPWSLGIYKHVRQMLAGKKVLKVAGAGAILAFAGILILAGHFQGFSLQSAGILASVFVPALLPFGIGALRSKTARGPPLVPIERTTPIPELVRRLEEQFARREDLVSELRRGGLLEQGDLDTDGEGWFEGLGLSQEQWRQVLIEVFLQASKLPAPRPWPVRILGLLQNALFWSPVTFLVRPLLGPIHRFSTAANRDFRATPGVAHLVASAVAAQRAGAADRGRVGLLGSIEKEAAELALGKRTLGLSVRLLARTSALGLVDLAKSQIMLWATGYAASFVVTALLAPVALSVLGVSLVGIQPVLVAVMRVFLSCAPRLIQLYRRRRMQFPQEPLLKAIAISSASGAVQVVTAYGNTLLMGELRQAGLLAAHPPLLAHEPIPAGPPSPEAAHPEGTHAETFPVARFNHHPYEIPHAHPDEPTLSKHQPDLVDHPKIPLNLNKEDLTAHPVAARVVPTEPIHVENHPKIPMNLNKEDPPAHPVAVRMLHAEPFQETAAPDRADAPQPPPVSLAPAAGQNGSYLLHGQVLINLPNGQGASLEIVDANQRYQVVAIPVNLDSDPEIEAYRLQMVVGDRTYTHDVTGAYMGVTHTYDLGIQVDAVNGQPPTFQQAMNLVQGSLDARHLSLHAWVDQAEPVAQDFAEVGEVGVYNTHMVQVVAGDSLWAIAERELAVRYPGGYSPALVPQAMNEIIAFNRIVSPDFYTSGLGLQAGQAIAIPPDLGEAPPLMDPFVPLDVHVGADQNATIHHLVTGEELAVVTGTHMDTEAPVALADIVHAGTLHPAGMPVAPGAVNPPVDEPDYHPPANVHIDPGTTEDPPTVLVAPISPIVVNPEPHGPGLIPPTTMNIGPGTPVNVHAVVTPPAVVGPALGEVPRAGLFVGLAISGVGAAVLLFKRFKRRMPDLIPMGMGSVFTLILISSIGSRFDPLIVKIMPQLVTFVPANIPVVLLSLTVVFGVIAYRSWKTVKLKSVKQKKKENGKRTLSEQDMRGDSESLLARWEALAEKTQEDGVRSAPDVAYMLDTAREMIRRYPISVITVGPELKKTGYLYMETIRLSMDSADRLEKLLSGEARHWSQTDQEQILLQVADLHAIAAYLLQARELLAAVNNVRLMAGYIEPKDSMFERRLPLNPLVRNLFGMTGERKGAQAQVAAMLDTVCALGNEVEPDLYPAGRREQLHVSVENQVAKIAKGYDEADDLGVERQWLSRKMMARRISLLLAVPTVLALVSALLGSPAAGGDLLKLCLTLLTGIGFNILLSRRALVAGRRDAFNSGRQTDLDQRRKDLEQRAGKLGLTAPAPRLLRLSKAQLAYEQMEQSLRREHSSFDSIGTGSADSVIILANPDDWELLQQAIALRPEVWKGLPTLVRADPGHGSGAALTEVFQLINAELGSDPSRPLTDRRAVAILLDAEEGVDRLLEPLGVVLEGGAEPVLHSPLELALMNGLMSAQALQRQGRGGVVVVSGSHARIGPPVEPSPATITLGTFRATAREAEDHQLGIAQALADGTIYKLYKPFEPKKIAGLLERYDLDSRYALNNDSLHQLLGVNGHIVFSFSDPEELSRFTAMLDRLRPFEGWSYYQDLLTLLVRRSRGEDVMTYLRAIERKAERNGQPFDRPAFEALYHEIAASAPNMTIESVIADGVSYLDPFHLPDTWTAEPQTPAPQQVRDETSITVRVGRGLKLVGAVFFVGGALTGGSVGTLFAAAGLVLVVGGVVMAIGNGSIMRLSGRARAADARATAESAVVSDSLVADTNDLLRQWEASLAAGAELKEPELTWVLDIAEQLILRYRLTDQAVLHEMKSTALVYRRMLGLAEATAARLLASAEAKKPIQGVPEPLVLQRIEKLQSMAEYLILSHQALGWANNVRIMASYVEPEESFYEAVLPLNRWVRGLWGITGERRHSERAYQDALPRIQALGNELEPGLYPKKESTAFETSMLAAVREIGRGYKLERDKLGGEETWLWRKMSGRRWTLIFTVPTLLLLFAGFATGTMDPGTFWSLMSAIGGGIALTLGITRGFLLSGRLDLQIVRIETALNKQEQRLRKIGGPEAPGWVHRLAAMSDSLESEIIDQTRGQGACDAVVIQVPPEAMEAVQAYIRDNPQWWRAFSFSGNAPILFMPDSGQGTAASVADLMPFVEASPEMQMVLEVKGRDALRIAAIRIDPRRSPVEVIQPVRWPSKERIGRMYTPLDIALMNAMQSIRLLAQDGVGGIALVSANDLRLGDAVEPAGDITLGAFRASYADVQRHGLGILQAFPAPQNDIYKMYAAFEPERISEQLERHAVFSRYDLHNRDVRQLLSTNRHAVVRFGDAGRREAFGHMMAAVRAVLDAYPAQAAELEEDVLVPVIMTVHGEDVLSYLEAVLRRTDQQNDPQRRAFLRELYAAVRNAVPEDFSLKADVALADEVWLGSSGEIDAQESATNGHHAQAHSGLTSVTRILARSLAHVLSMHVAPRAFVLVPMMITSRPVFSLMDPFLPGSVETWQIMLAAVTVGLMGFTFIRALWQRRSALPKTRPLTLHPLLRTGGYIVGLGMVFLVTTGFQMSFTAPPLAVAAGIILAIGAFSGLRALARRRKRSGPPVQPVIIHPEVPESDFRDEQIMDWQS